MPEVQARRLLGSRVVAFSVLAPVGSFAGKGALRVLRVAPMKTGDGVELLCGYDGYERWSAA